jgi:hypothetical protein
MADKVGIVWPMKGIIKAKIFDDGMTIKLDDLVRWVGINPGSFKNIRGSVAKARLAWERLKRNAPLLHKKDTIAADTLKILLFGDQIEFPDLNESFNMDEGEWDAVRMTGDGLDKLVKRVMEQPE